jgi:ABC-type lipoprotein release transport system permease subunit
VARRCRAALFAATIAATGRSLATSAPPDAQPSVLLSRQLVEARHLHVGDVVRLSVNPSGKDAREFRLVGSFEPMPDPMRLTSKRYEARLHLPDLGALTSVGADPETAEAVDAISVALRDPSPAGALAEDLTGQLPGLVALPSGGAGDARAAPFEVLERFHQAIALVAVLGSTAFLLALMVMRAEERRETVGILRLLGFPKRSILLEVLIEGLFIAVAGAVFGVLFATATQGLVNLFFQSRYDTSLVFVRVTVPIAARCVALTVPLGMTAGLLASWTLLRREISELLRR